MNAAIRWDAWRLCRPIALALVWLTAAAPSIGASDGEIPVEEWQKLALTYPTYRNIAQSGAFKAWLELQTPQLRQLAAGGRTAADVIAVFDAFQRERVINGGAEFLRLTCVLRAATGRQSEPPTTMTLWVDVLTARVNGSPATITSSSISFPGLSRDQSIATIDRYTGAISVGDAKFPVFATGNCVSAGPRLF